MASKATSLHAPPCGPDRRDPEQRAVGDTGDTAQQPLSAHAGARNRGKQPSSRALLRGSRKARAGGAAASPLPSPGLPGLLCSVRLPSLSPSWAVGQGGLEPLVTRLTPLPRTRPHVAVLGPSVSLWRERIGGSRAQRSPAASGILHSSH